MPRWEHPLEQRCHRPGLWYIEGYQVVRRRRYGLPCWWVYKPTWDGGKELLEVAPSLAAARDLIRQELTR